MTAIYLALMFFTQPKVADVIVPTDVKTIERPQVIDESLEYDKAVDDESH